MINFRYDPFNNPPTTLCEAEQQKFYFISLIRSLEAKLERIEPLSDEFEETMSTIYDAQKARDQAFQNWGPLKYREVTKEYLKGMD